MRTTWANFASRAPVRLHYNSEPSERKNFKRGAPESCRIDSMRCCFPLRVPSGIGWVGQVPVRCVRAGVARHAQSGLPRTLLVLNYPLSCAEMLETACPGKAASLPRFDLQWQGERRNSELAKTSRAREFVRVLSDFSGDRFAVEAIVSGHIRAVAILKPAPDGRPRLVQVPKVTSNQRSVL